MSASVVNPHRVPRTDSCGRHALGIRVAAGPGVCNAHVTEEEGVQRRPWPASGEDEDWWRSDSADQHAPPAEPATPVEPPARPFTEAPRTATPPAPPRQPAAEAPPPVIPLVRPLPPPPDPELEPDPEPEVAAPAAEEAPRFATVTVPVQRLPAATPAQRPRRVPRQHRYRRGHWIGLPALVVLASMGAFFAWVSAEPFWLTMGHGHNGLATVVRAPGSEMCQARFVADGEAFVADTVNLAGLTLPACTEGTTVPARMVSAKAQRAYATDAAGFNLRWGLGFGLVLLCGLAIMSITGAVRFTGWQRATSVGLSLTAPLAVTVAMLVAAY